MLFNSLTFLIFLPIVFLVYWFAVQRRLRLQNVAVVVVSYIFYGWWDWKFLLLIALTSFCSWLSGIWMGDRDGAAPPVAGLRGRRLFVMVANIVLNLGILGYFKYYNFFVESFVHAAQSIGLSVQIPLMQVVLPVGISFYTFQALSYSIDVYRGHIKPTRDIVAFFAYVCFFPQLVAGPIERATNLLPQFLAPRSFDDARAVDGCRQMLWGFFKKMVVADNCARVANALLDQPSPRGIACWIAMVCFAMQIYGDFSGYSDIAIGCARLFGIRLMRNFAYPYFSRDIAEFWRRWHISLSTWFRDYVYVPLGGSRTSKARWIRNTFIIFLVSGLWHGANWTFIAWGALHACFFLPLLLLKRNRRHFDTVAEGRWLPSGREVLKMGLTFTMVVLSWTFFRAPDIDTAFQWVFRMLAFDSLFAGNGASGGTMLLGCMPWIGVMILVEWANRRYLHGLERLPGTTWVRWCVYVGLALAILLFRGDQKTFIYFQF